MLKTIMSLINTFHFCNKNFKYIWPPLFHLLGSLLHNFPGLEYFKNLQNFADKDLPKLRWMLGNLIHLIHFYCNRIEENLRKRVLDSLIEKWKSSLWCCIFFFKSVVSCNSWKSLIYRSLEIDIWNR